MLWSYPAEPDADLSVGQHTQVEALRAGLDQEGPLGAPEGAEEPPRPTAQKVHHDTDPSQITATPGRTDSVRQNPKPGSYQRDSVSVRMS